MFISVQLSHVLLFVTPWTAARQASLSITNSRSLLKLMSIESVMPPNHLIPCCPLLLPPSIFPSIRVFSNESVLCIRCQSIGTLVSALASALPMNIHDWFPLGWTGWISLLSKGLLRVFSNITVQNYMYSFFFFPSKGENKNEKKSLKTKMPPVSAEESQTKIQGKTQICRKKNKK